MLHKSLYTVLVAAALLTLASAAAIAAIDVAITPDIINVPPQSQFTVEITVTSAGSQFNGYDVTVTYDPSLISYVSKAEGSLMTSACATRFENVQFPDASSIMISHVLLCAGVSVAGPGVVYRLTFETADVGAASTDLLLNTEFFDAGTLITPVNALGATVVIEPAVSADANSWSTVKVRWREN